MQTRAATAGVRVTALLLTWNSAKTVAETIESLLAQDYPSFDVLVSDDASADDTAAICEKYALEDSRVCVVRQAKNLGSFENLHAACKVASADFVLWACPGDTWDPRFVSACVAALNSVPNAVTALCATTYVAERTREVLRTERFDHGRLVQNISHWRLATMIPVKSRPADRVRRRFGLFIHGLLHRATLSKALESLEGLGGISSERVVMCQFALAGRFVATPVPLFFKESSEMSFIHRAPHDPNARRRSDNHLAVMKTAWQLACSLLRSQAFPLHRKVYIPLIVGYFVGWNAFDRGRIGTVTALRRVLPAPLYNKVRWLGASFAGSPGKRSRS